jgi:hypothetical protein
MTVVAERSGSRSSRLTMNHLARPIETSLRFDAAISHVNDAMGRPRDLGEIGHIG